MNNQMAVVAITITLCVFSVVVQAGDDPKYPGYDFQSEVIYRSPELVESLKSPVKKHEVDPKYPAAYFTPVVIYPGKKLINKEIKKRVETTKPNPPARKAVTAAQKKPLAQPTPRIASVDTDSFPTGVVAITVFLILGIFQMLRQKTPTDPEVVAVVDEEVVTADENEADEASDSDDSDNLDAEEKQADSSD